MNVEALYWGCACPRTFNFSLSVIVECGQWPRRLPFLGLLPVVGLFREQQLGRYVETNYVKDTFRNAAAD